jgi:37-kD nucleoid-associated bacterial protein
MILNNLTITRITAHEIFKRADDRTLIPPKHGQELIVLGAQALTELADRIVSVVGKASRSMEMTIANAGVDSAVDVSRQLVSAATDAEFIAISAKAADKLAESQASRAIPGGVLVVIVGGVGFPARKITVFIKAEVQSGFVKKLRADGSLAVEFLTELFLTPESKLYKIGVFVAPALALPLPPPVPPLPPILPPAFPAGWEASVYDVAMTAGNRMTAAQYFYERFLGLAFPQNAAMMTKQFHDLTKTFIGNLNVAEEKKSDLHNALITYLKVDVNNAIHVGEFAELYFDDPDIKDGFSNYMAENHFPLEQVVKDTSDIQKSLRFRKVTFPRDVKLIAPVESFSDLIQIETIDGDVRENGQVPKWTKIIVKEKIQHQT